MQDSRKPAKSKGLNALLAEAKELDVQYAKAMAQADPGVVQAVQARLQTAIGNYETYQSGHKENTSSRSDREKFVQAESLMMHYHLMLSDITATLPVLTTLDAIDTKALASNEAGALRAMGQIDGIKASALCDAAKALAEKKRRALVANMMKTATTPDQIREVAMMAGPDFNASYERQMALGPLTKTAGESRTARDHQSTRIQPAADAATVDETRRLAERLISDDGRLELAALYVCNPEDLAGDAPSSRQTARALKRLRNDPEAIEILENIQALETNTVKLSRGDNPDLLGSSTGGTLADKTKLEEAPAFQATFATRASTRMIARPRWRQR